MNEAGANAIEHAYRDGRAGDITVEGEMDTDLVVRLIDHGTWRFGGGDPNRGRGMHIMPSLVDDVEIVRGSDGTSVVIRRSAPGPQRGQVGSLEAPILRGRRGLGIRFGGSATR